MNQVLDFVTSPTSIGVALAIASAVGAISTVAMPLLQGDRLQTRLKAVAARREELKRKSRAALAGAAQPSAQLRHAAGKGVMARLVERFDLSQALADDTLAKKLAQAGLRGKAPETAFYFFRAALPLVFAGGAALYLWAFGGAFDLTLQLKALIVVGAAALGFYGPNIYLSNLISKRQASIMSAFPDALDMLLICVESGMSIDLALQRVAQEIGSASIELAEELSLCSAELSYLPDRRQAFENLARRTDHPGVRSVALALTQAERYGTPLGQALRIMAKENRELRLTNAEKKAASLPAKLTVPMILFFIPVLFAVILTPAIIQISDVQKEREQSE